MIDINQIYLCDSGGELPSLQQSIRKLTAAAQYLDGTTDTTRTLVSHIRGLQHDRSLICTALWDTVRRGKDSIHKSREFRSSYMLVMKMRDAAYHQLQGHIG
jgi:hypothetical protein